jgi:putative cell wall-binding protein
VAGPSGRVGRRRGGVALLVGALLVASPGVGPLGIVVGDGVGGAVGGAAVAHAEVLAGEEAPVVRRLAGSDRAATAAAIAADAWSAAATVVVADGREAATALVGAHLAARLDVPVLLGGPGVPPVTAAALDALAPTRLVVVGDVDLGAAGEDRVVDHLAAGPAAEVAAAAVRLEPGTQGMPVVLAADGAAADALAAASIAPARLLLTAADRLDESARRALLDLDPVEVVLVGGTAALSEAVEAAVVEAGLPTRRLAGPSRYDTGLAVVTSAGRAHPSVVVAAGERFADALAVVPHVARRGTALLLTPHDELPGAVLDHLGQAGYGDAVVVGGTVAVGSWVDRQLGAALAGVPEPSAVRSVRQLSDAEREVMTGPAWRPGCPVGLDDLRVVELTRWLPSGDVADDGVLVVHADAADGVAQVVQALFDARFPIEQARPVEAFGGDDDASMAANNSSAFNCRTVAGTATWSQHAYGRAIDLNPVQNPYVRGEQVEPEAGRAFLDRTDVRPGMVVRPGPVVDAFAAIGWGWGGDFSTSRDYQHFSATGG